jgi:pyridoxamine 5'-phosphate oxidase
MDPGDLDDDPLRQLAAFLTEAHNAGAPSPYAMALATIGLDGQPSVRMVMLRGVDTALVFFSDDESAKGIELASNPGAAAVLHWLAPVQRQVRVTGRATETSSEESDRYWAVRPPGARWSELAVQQSKVVADRSVLERAVADAKARYPDESAVPRPARWRGFRLTPEVVEFWEERGDRLHDRIRYRRRDGGWIVERLAP